jgi:hypothetical protein
MKSIQAPKQDNSVSLKISAIKVDPRAAGITAIGLIFNKV